MPKRRPIFEFKGLSGFFGSSSSDSSYRFRSGYTNESPRRPSFSLSSRYQSSGRHRRRSGKHKNRRKHHKHHYSRHGHYAADQRYRRRRYEDELQDEYYSHKIRERSFAGEEMPEDVPVQRRRAHFADEDPLDDELSARNMRSPSSDASRRRLSRSSQNLGRAHLRSPPPFDPHIQYRSPSIEYPQPSRQSPGHSSRERRKSNTPSRYADDYNPAERAVDPRLEHSFNPSGLPEDDDSERASSRSFAGHSDLGRRRRHHRHHRRRGQKRSSRRRRRQKRDGDDSEGSDKGSIEGDSGSEEAERDEEGNLIESAARSKSGSKKKMKKGKKRGIAKIAALALGAVVAGLIVKKIIGKRKKKKAEQDAQAAAAQQEAAEAYGGSEGELYSRSSRLQLPIPKGSFSVKVPQTEAFIVERGGRYNRRLNPGSNMLIPFVDRVAYRFSLKEISMVVPEQQCYTHENVGVVASALLFVKVEDAVATAYGVDDARRSLMLLAQTCMRKEIARLGVEHMLQDREGLAGRILVNMNRASRPWGIRCTRFDISDLHIPEDVRLALGRQAEVERQVRADVLASEGAREAMKNRADGEMHAQMRMSQARQIEAVNQAIGEAHAISERGEAIAGAMRDVAEVITEPGGEKAMQMRIAEQYIHSYANAAKNQDHFPPPPNPTDMAAAMSNALDLLDKLAQSGSTVANPHMIPGTNSGLPTPALEHQPGGNSQSGDETQPPPAASHLSGPSPGASSHEPSESHQDTPQVPQAGVRPADPQYIPQNTSSVNPSAPSSHEGMSVSHETPQVQTAMVPHYRPSPGQYAGPVYPQA